MCVRIVYGTKTFGHGSCLVLTGINEDFLPVFVIKSPTSALHNNIFPPHLMQARETKQVNVVNMVWAQLLHQSNGEP